MLIGHQLISLKKYKDYLIILGCGIRKDGTLMGYVPGAMEKDMMTDVIRQTLESDAGI